MSGAGVSSPFAKQALRMARAAGWRWRLDGRGHVVLYPRDGSRAIALSRGRIPPSGERNKRAQLRRAGLPM